MNAMLNPVQYVRAIAVATVLLVIVLLPQHADAQCAISYGDAYEDGTYVYGWNTVIDYYNQSGCNQGYWGFVHDYSASTTLQSPSGRIATGSGASSAWSGGGYTQSLAVLEIGNDFGEYSFSRSEAIFCTAMAAIIYEALTGGTVTVPRSFDVRIQAFIPWAWVYDGGLCSAIPLATPVFPTIAGGDNRSYDRDGTFRIRSYTVLRPSVGSALTGVSVAGQSHQYEKSTSVGSDSSGYAVPLQDAAEGDCYRTHRTGYTTGIENVSVVLSGNASLKWARAQFVGGAGYPFTPGPDIDWDVTVTISTGSTPPTWTINYSHDCFPAFEVYVGSQRIYGVQPTDGSFINIGYCLSGGGQVSGSDSGSLN